ncbi:uncharacterized protein LOC101854780 [Aplysia californica]|uniref:Uncharacterized protein LOC101854780 n=1 Tax=Aplysia californica TaxID=6500 RepID=A0ABM0JGE7_APLCA|nr:uncharacterized protein LOC101854780 [Aplysia californica]
MMLKTLLCVSAFVFVTVNAKVGDVCQDVSACGQEECCVKYGPDAGTCQKNLSEDAPCHNMQILLSRSCPCETGLRCLTVDTDMPFVSKRDSLTSANLPGEHGEAKCAKLNTDIDDVVVS